MAVNPSTKPHLGHHENLDPQANANLAVWSGLVAVTLMTSPFVASNVCLRGWNRRAPKAPSKVAEKQGTANSAVPF